MRIEWKKDYFWVLKSSFDLLVTDKKLALLYPGGKLNQEKDIKRIISYQNLKGATKSKQKDVDSFVLHIKNSEDELIYCGDITEAIDIIKKAYAFWLNANLPIFSVDSSTLYDYTTSYNDLIIGITRMPLWSLRQKEERVIPELNSSDDEEEKELIQGYSIIGNDEFRKKTRTSGSYLSPTSISRETDKKEDGLSITLYPGTNIITIRKIEITLDHFIIIKLLDIGFFGKIFLTQWTIDKKFYTMKRIRKDHLILTNHIESILNEKYILLYMNHPFLLRMDYVFQNDLRVYFFLEYAKGGSLKRNLLENKRFKENVVKFYAAQIALALNYLHENKVTHRDLKPENVLVEENGYIKLSDFGLAKFIKGEDGAAFSYWGTNEYLSPEVIRGEGYSFEVDWWAFGILIYELIVGRPPFMNWNHQKLEQLILKGKLVFPDEK